MATQFRELVNPSEVQISSGHEVFLAQPVVTPIERLRRKDKEVARALEEKQRLIEEILNIPHEELESITESANIHTMGQQQPKTAAEILLSALSQAKVLTSLVNRTLKLSEEEAMAAMAIKNQEEKMATGVISEQQRIVAKGERLIEITTAINKQLTLLLAIIQDNEREREALKRELAKPHVPGVCDVLSAAVAHHPGLHLAHALAPDLQVLRQLEAQHLQHPVLPVQKDVSTL